MPHPSPDFEFRPIGGLHDRAKPTEISPSELAETNHVSVAKGSFDSALGYRVLTRTVAPRLGLRFGLQYDGPTQLGPYLYIPALTKLSGSRNWTIEFGIRHEMDTLVSPNPTSLRAGLAKWGSRDEAVNGPIHVYHNQNGEAIVRVPAAADEAVCPGVEPWGRRWLSIVSDDAANLLRVFSDGIEIDTIAGDVLASEDAFVIGVCPGNTGANETDFALSFAVEEFRAFDTNVAASELLKWAGKKLSLEDAHANAANLVSLIRMDEAGARFCRDLKRPHLPAFFGPTGAVVVETGSPESDVGEKGYALAVDGLWSFLQADLTSREFNIEWEKNFQIDAGGGQFDSLGGIEVGFTLLAEVTGTVFEAVRTDANAAARSRIKLELAVSGAGVGLRATWLNGNDAAPATMVTGIGAPISVGERHVALVRKQNGGTLFIALDGDSGYASAANSTDNSAGVAPNHLRVGAGFADLTQATSAPTNPVPLLIDAVRILPRHPTNAQIARFGRGWKEEEWEEPGTPRLASFTKGLDTVSAASNFSNVALGQGILVRVEQEWTPTNEQVPKTTPIGFGVVESVAGSTITLARAWEGRSGSSYRWAFAHLISYMRASKLDLDFGCGPALPVSSSLTEVADFELTAFPVSWAIGAAPASRPFGSPDAGQPEWAIGFLREDRDNPGTGIRYFRAPSTGRDHWLAFGGFGVAEYDDRRRLVDGRRFMAFRHPQDGIEVAGSIPGSTFQIEAFVVPDLIDGLRPIVTINGFRFGILNGRLDAAQGATIISGTKTVPRGRRIHVEITGTWGGTVRMFQEGELVASTAAFVFPGAHTTYRIGRRSTTGKGTETFGGLIGQVRIDDVVAHTASFAPPTTITQAGATSFVDCGIGDDFLLSETVATPDAPALVLSPPLLEVSPRLGPSKRSPRGSFATIFDRAVYTTSIGPPEQFDGTDVGRDGIFPPLAAPTLTLVRSPWWSSDQHPFLSANVSKGGSLVFYGVNWISYAVSNLPQDEFPDQATANFKLPLVMFGRKESAGANDGTGVVIDGWIKVDLNAPRERMPLVLRRADETDEGNFSLWVVPKTEAGTGNLRWGLQFAFFDSKDRAVRSFEQSTAVAARLFASDVWVYFAIQHKFGDAAARGLSIDNTASGTATVVATAELPATGLANDDTPAKPEFNGALEIGGGAYLIERSKPLGFVGKIGEIRIGSSLQGHNEVTLNTNAVPSIPLSKNYSGVITNAGFTGGHPTRARVVFGNDEGRGYRVQNVLHFKDPTGTAASGDAQYTADPKAEFQPFADLLSKQGPPHIDGKIQVVTTFFDPLFNQESNPSPIETIDTGSTSGQEDSFAVTELVVSGLPISAERPMERRVYRTIPDGGVFFLDEEVHDGVSGEVRLIRSNASLAARQELATDNAQAPNCRALAATESRVVYGGLIDEGPGLVAWSKAFIPGAVPGTNRQAVGSPLGGDVTAPYAWGGRLIVNKDDNFQLGTFGDDSTLSLAPLEEPYGAAGPMAIAGADRLLPYVTRKGLYAWTGQSQAYIGRRIEGSFADVADPSEAVVFYDPNQTIWCALLRNASSGYLDTLVRMDVSGAPHGMTVSRGWPIESAGLGVGVDGRFRLLGMTAMGSVVALENGVVAGNSSFDPVATLTWASTVTPTTLAQFAVTVTGGPFPSLGDGLRGAAGVHIRSGVVTPIVVWRAFGTTLEYDGPSPLAGDTFLVGAYEKLGVGPVSALGAEHFAKRIEYVMIHATPGGISGDTTVEVAVDSGGFNPVTAKPLSLLPANTTKPWQLLVADRIPQGVYFQFRVRALFGSFSIRAIGLHFNLVEPRP